MERQKDINLKFLELVKSKEASELSHLISIAGNYSQFINANSDEVPQDYKELWRMKVQSYELNNALRWLLDIGILLRKIIKDTDEGFIRKI